MYLRRVIRFSLTRDEAFLFRKRSRPSYSWQGYSDLLDLPSLLAAAAPVVFEHEADLVALVE